MKTFVVIPALDEEETIGAVVAALFEQPIAGVIVVDNGSADSTTSTAQKAGATVILEPRRGYGYACAAGTKVALDAGAEVLVYIDADFSSLPSELPQLLAPLAADDVALVLGSRMLGTIQKGAMPPHQRFGNWLSSGLMRLLYRIDVTDLGPYRAIRASVLQQLDMREMTFGWPTEMQVKVAKRGLKIVEVPTSWHVRRGGQSKVSGTIKGSILAASYILGVTLRYAMRR